MTNSLSLGWTRAIADKRIASHRRVFATALALQMLIGVIFMLFPGFALRTVGLDVSMGPEWPSIWGAMLIFATLLQVPGWMDPVRQRFPNLIAVIGRGLMVCVFLVHGGAFLWFAAFDAVFGVLLALGFRRMVIAELMTRP